METAMEALEQKLGQGQGHFTLNEASAITGVSVDDARDALNALIKKYICRMQVTENGDLIYDFGKSPQRRERITIAERMAIAGQWAWKAFVFIFRIWIAFTLVVYFFISFFIIVALICFFVFSSLSDKRSENSDNSASSGMAADLFAVIFRLFGELIMQTFGTVIRFFASLSRWKTNTDRTIVREDDQGYSYRKYESNPGVINPKKKNFIASVYDFVFGPERVQIDPLNNEKEVAAFLKDQKGILVLAELIGLAGWTMRSAREFFTDCLVRFRGDVHVTDNGVMFGRFDDIVRGIGKAETGAIEWYWDEYEPEYEVTGNSTWLNGLICFMNCTTLMVSFEIMRFFSFIADFPGTAYETVTYRLLLFFPVTISTKLVSNFNAEEAAFLCTWLGWVPFTFSVLFFLIPFIRSIKYKRANEKRRHTNMQKRVIKAIFAVRGAPQTLGDYLKRINENARETPIERGRLEALLNEFVLDMEGDTEVSENGELFYRFRRIADELEDVRTIRSETRISTELGDVIVDSE